MPDDLAEVFDLIYYADLNQQQTADVLGVSLATVKRRWRDAKLWIYNNLGGQLPGDTGEFPLL